MDHWRQFEEFCTAETATGGPDPQIALITHLAKDKSDVEKVWLAGCYGAHHCVPSAYMVWKTFRPEEVIEDYSALETWLTEKWQYLPVRPEMRSHRMVEKRADCLYDFANFALGRSWANEGTYEQMWYHSQQEVRYYGRYMAIKFLEMMRRSVAPWLQMPDMRAKDAWSPRIALSLLFPDHPILANRELKSRDIDTLVDECAERAILRLKGSGITVDFFQIQVMLCEYREMLVGGYYAGASHDEELDYMRLARGGGVNFQEVLDARQAIFPKWALGEINGWEGLRKPCFEVFKRDHVIWSDKNMRWHG